MRLLEIIVDNRDGKLWDISEIVTSVRYSTKRIGEPSSLDLTFVKGGLFQDKAFKLNPGDVVQVRQGKLKVFYGNVFTIDFGRDEDVNVKAYDQLRYLSTSESYAFQGVTATQIIQQIAKDAELKVGKLADTEYAIPRMVEHNKKLLDMIYKALNLTLIYGGKNFVFFDDFGTLSIRDIATWKLDFGIGDKSLLYDYKIGRSIDNDTYNRVKIVQDDKEAGIRKVFIEQDSATIAKWGRLQLYQVADEKMTKAQISENLKNLMMQKNRELRSIRLDAIGDLRVRAGCYIHAIIAEAGIDQDYLVEACTHQLVGDDHTMTLDLKVIG